MAEKLTLKKLSDELDMLRAQMGVLEQRLEHRIDTLQEAVSAVAASGNGAAKSPGHATAIDVAQHQQLIAEAAYLIAEQRGFQGGDPAQDWAEAERQVNERLMQQGTASDKAATRAKRPARKKPASKPTRATK
jgi:uncharacterized protein with PhoU and TrkA domain